MTWESSAILILVVLLHGVAALLLLFTDRIRAWCGLDRGAEDRADADARPSDALAIALRMYASIHVNEKLLEESECTGPGTAVEITDDESKKWTEILQNLSPEDFGKYKM